MCLCSLVYTYVCICIYHNYYLRATYIHIGAKLLLRSKANDTATQDIVNNLVSEACRFSPLFFFLSSFCLWFWLFWSLALSLCRQLCLCVSGSVSLPVALSLCQRLCLFISSLCLCVSIFGSLSPSVGLCLCIQLCLSVSACLCRT